MSQEVLVAPSYAAGTGSHSRPLSSGSQMVKETMDNDGYSLVLYSTGAGSISNSMGKPSGKELNVTTSRDKFCESTEDRPPPDRLWLVFTILLIHGLGILMPWNMFITAKAYFVDYKLSPHRAPLPRNSYNSTENVTVNVSDYSKNFLEYLGIVAKLPNLLLSLLNLFFHIGGRSRIRIAYALVLSLGGFLLTLVLAAVDSSAWTVEFFYITMITVAIVNSATGMYQNSIFGLAAILPMRYTNAVVLGNNISGIFTSIVAILSKVCSPNLRTAAIWYFAVAVFVLLVCLATYFALPLLKFFTYYDIKNEEQYKEGAIQRMVSRLPYMAIFKNIWVQCFNIWFVFLVTLTCFPAIQANIEAIDTSSPLVSADLFTEVTCFLLFSLFAVAGNMMPGVVKFPGPRWVVVPVVARALFIPLLMFCNYRPDYRTLPVLISNDYAYMIVAMLMAITSGYYSSLVMMYTPALVETQYASTAGQMAAFFLVFGTFCGVSFSRAISAIIEIHW